MPRVSLLVAAALLALPACDLVKVPEDSPELATYYVSSNRLTGAPTTNATVGYASRIAIEWVSPDGVMRDTLTGAGTTWSKVYERSALSEFRLTARNLTTDTTRAQLLKGFVGASLLVDGAILAKDSAKAVASVDAASPVIEGQ